MSEENFRREIEVRKKSKAGLNNFEGNFPGGWRYYYAMENPDMLEMPFTIDENVSEFLRTRTQGEFYRDCAEAVLASGNEEDYVHDMAFRRGLGEIHEEEYIELMAPIYITLRRKGYRERDLTG